MCLACGGRAADGDGLASFDPDGTSGGAFGGSAGIDDWGDGDFGGPPRPPRDVSGNGMGGSGVGVGDMAPDPGAGPLAPDDRSCPQLPLGQIEVHDQGELEALRGCASLAGDLTIYPFRAADLTPLSELQRVGGTLTLGDPFAESRLLAFGSLTGLESLRSVGGLVLRGVRASSLVPLSGLVELTLSDGIAPISGYVSIDRCPALQDLQGLDNLEGLRVFLASRNENLVSLRGLRVPPVLDGFEIWDSPVSDFSALRELIAVNQTLSLVNTGLTHMADFAQLSRARQLQLANNASLSELQGLAGLTSVDYFLITGNPLLPSLPEFSLLSAVSDLTIEDNASLTEVRPMGALRQVASAAIRNNPLLIRATALGAVEHTGDLHVEGNAVLSVLDLSHLAAVDGLLRVAHNPSLEAGGLPRPAGANVVIGGNLGDALGLDPCPWSGNGYCEGTPNDDLCAAGSDSDCGPYGAP